MGTAPGPPPDSGTRCIDPLLARTQRDPDGPAAPAIARRVRSRRLRARLGPAAIVLVVVAVPILYSYVRALTGPGHDSAAARSVEWLRDHRMGWLVDTAERTWFASHQAKEGGTPDPHVLTPPAARDPKGPSSTVGPTPPPAGISRPAPTANVTTTPPTTVDPLASRLAPPAPLVSPAVTPFPGEGSWLPLGPDIHGSPGAYVSSIRPDAVHLSSVVGVAWFDPHVVAFRQFPGLWIPGAPWDRPPQVPPADQGHLIATFAGGFRLGSSHGGMILGGREQRPTRDGAATFAIDPRGMPSIGAWNQDLPASGPWDSVRQNLDLIVQNGQPNPALATDPNRLWGFTGPANHQFVWRSGAGILANGALVWIGGPGLSISTLADLFVRLGAVRAMQLDINHEWVQFNTYSSLNGAIRGTRLLKDMRGPDDRWLSEDTRDFFAVFVRP